MDIVHNSTTKTLFHRNGLLSSYFVEKVAMYLKHIQRSEIPLKIENLAIVANRSQASNQESHKSNIKSNPNCLK